jgi:DNA invertase Pin-like site-specific DNA recombinase
MSPLVPEPTDCVRAGLRLAQSKGKRLGRPHTAVDAKQVAAMRAKGDSWRVVSERLGIGVGTACRALQGCSKNLPESCAVNA